MTSCACGSTKFVVEYQTTARLNLDTGAPVAVTYGPIRDGGMFSTITCAECAAKLDIDNTLIGTDPVASFAAFMTARYRADILAGELPSVTVRTRNAAISPVGMPAQRIKRDECPN